MQQCYNSFQSALGARFCEIKKMQMHKNKVSEFKGDLECFYMSEQRHPQFLGLNVLNVLRQYFKKLLFKH